MLFYIFYYVPFHWILKSLENGITTGYVISTIFFIIFAILYQPRTWGSICQIGVRLRFLQKYNLTHVINPIYVIKYQKIVISFIVIIDAKTPTDYENYLITSNSSYNFYQNNINKKDYSYNFINQKIKKYKKQYRSRKWEKRGLH